MKKWIAFIIAVIMITLSVSTAIAAGNGFDQYGYNDNGNIFNGTGSVDVKEN